MEDTLASTTRKLEEQAEEFKNYKQRANAVLEKRKDQIDKLTVDDQVTDKLKSDLEHANERVEALDKKTSELTELLQDKTNENEVFSSQLRAATDLQSELDQSKKTNSELERKCNKLVEKERVTAKELAVWIVAIFSLL